MPMPGATAFSAVTPDPRRIGKSDMGNRGEFRAQEWNQQGCQAGRSVATQAQGTPLDPGEWPRGVPLSVRYLSDP
jgi:hypothetical protein